MPKPPASTAVQSKLASRQLRELEDAAYDFYDGFDAAADRGIATAALLRAHRLLVQRLSELLAPYSLTPIQMDLMGALVLAPDCQLSGVELRQHTFMSSATMTHTLNLLEKRDLIRRQSHATNRRVIVIQLTDAGQALVMEAALALGAAGAGLYELDGEQARGLAALLSHVGADAPSDQEA